MPLLIYTGPRLSTGEPERNLNYDGIPEGDLDPDALTPEQLEIVKRSGLYEQPKAAARKSAGAKE